MRVYIQEMWMTEGLPPAPVMEPVQPIRLIWAINGSSEKGPPCMEYPPSFIITLCSATQAEYGTSSGPLKLGDKEENHQIK